MVVDASMYEEGGTIVVKLVAVDGLNVRVIGYTVDGVKEVKSIPCV